MKNYFLILASLFLLSSSANASRTSLVAGVDYSLDPYGELGFQGGFLFDLQPLELGAVFLSKKYSVGTNNLVQFPIMYRFGGSSTSFGIGGFLDLYLSAVALNYGLTAGPRFSLSPKFFFDMRFNYGLKGSGTKDIVGLVGLYL